MRKFINLLLDSKIQIFYIYDGLYLTVLLVVLIKS